MSDDCADESVSNDEVDVTIPLTRDTTMSKITDFYEPKNSTLFRASSYD
jgi:hypothetical protein